MANDKFWVGMILGGLLGATIALLSNKTGVVQTADKKEEIDRKETDYKETDHKKDEQKPQEESLLKKGLNLDFDLDNIDKKKKNDNRKNGDKEKKQQKKEEERNPKNEVEKKTEEEGELPREQVTNKLSFGKKVAQLEEALKKLREENTK